MEQRFLLAQKSRAERGRLRQISSSRKCASSRSVFYVIGLSYNIKRPPTHTDKRSQNPCIELPAFAFILPVVREVYSYSYFALSYMSISKTSPVPDVRPVLQDTVYYQVHTQN